MPDTILLALETVFAVIGLVAVIYYLLMHFIRPGRDEMYYEVLVFRGGEQNACLRVSYLLSLLLSSGNSRHCRILAVDDGMSFSQRESLISAFGNDRNVVICTKEEACSVLFNGK